MKETIAAHTAAEKQRYMTKCFNEASERSRKRICKPVMWNEIEFESVTALGKYHKLFPRSRASDYIKRNRPLAGHIPEFIKR